MADAPIRIDPMVSLAFSVYSNPGVYALLIGSGVSRSARIPTGWEITCDLIEKVAAAEGAQEECNEVGPEAWYAKQFSAEPGYSDILRQLFPTQELRRAALASYFEPTEEEREADPDAKAPQPAHKAIASLVAGGYIRVILTTNFDKLIERALEAEGITPTVVSTPDQVKGCEPLAHSKHLVVKLHGDYRDSLQRNTESELSKYPPVLRTLLDRVLDEFGLIICGWSAGWDHALRGAIERCKSRRYATYWVDPAELTEQAAGLLQRRAGMFIANKADGFFQELEEKVQALEATAGPHPLSPALAAEAVKRYIASPEHRVRLRELVGGEWQRARRAISECPKDWADAQREQAFGWYEAETAALRRMLAAGCYLGETAHDALWAELLESVAWCDAFGGGTPLRCYLRRYPLLLCAYAVGTACIGASRYDALAELVLDDRYPGLLSPEPRVSLPMALWRFFDDAQCMFPAVGETMRALLRSRRLKTVAVADLSDVTIDARASEEAFDRFEIIWSMETTYQWTIQDGTDPAGRLGFAVGEFVLSGRDGQRPTWMRLVEEAASQGEEWAPLRAGFLGGSADVLRRFLDEVPRSFRRPL